MRVTEVGASLLLLALLLLLLLLVAVLAVCCRSAAAAGVASVRGRLPARTGMAAAEATLAGLDDDGWDRPGAESVVLTAVLLLFLPILYLRDIRAVMPYLGGILDQQAALGGQPYVGCNPPSFLCSSEAKANDQKST